MFEDVPERTQSEPRTSSFTSRDARKNGGACEKIKILNRFKVEFRLLFSEYQFAKLIGQMLVNK